MRKPGYEPIVYLMTDLSIAGTNLLEISGYLAAVWHHSDLDSFRDRNQIESARKAIAVVSAGLDAYEATLNPKNEAVG